MKLIEATRKPVNQDSVQKIIHQVTQLLSFQKSNENAGDAIIARFTRSLDNNFSMVRNLPVEDTDQTFPPLLVGPSGLVLLNIISVAGVFRARDDSWWEMSKSTHRFGPGRPNLIKQSQEYAKRLSDLLDRHGKSHPEVLPILVFANPGVQVETTNPAIRIVRMDGIDSLIGDLLNSEQVLSTNEINLLSDTFDIMGNPRKAIPVGEGEDFFGRDLLEPEKKASLKLPKVTLKTDLSLPPVEEKLKFTPKQWLILEVLMVMTIVVLLGGIVYVLLAY